MSKIPRRNEHISRYQQIVRGLNIMRITFELSDPAALELAPLGDLNVAAKEALVIRAYETGKISAGVAGQLMGINNRWDAEDWLERQGAFAPLSHPEVDNERTSLHQFPKGRS